MGRKGVAWYLAPSQPQRSLQGKMCNTTSHKQESDSQFGTQHITGWIGLWKKWAEWTRRAELELCINEHAELFSDLLWFIRIFFSFGFSAEGTFFLASVGPHQCSCFTDNQSIDNPWFLLFWCGRNKVPMVSLYYCSTSRACTPWLWGRKWSEKDRLCYLVCQAPAQKNQCVPP